MTETPKYTNRLVHETSPYLLQHAHNPVNWYPWGEEALQKAKQEDKPILLSVGYSACHWCHVMERESFENEEIAAIMNKYFIPVKVDREERPDIDSIYMQAVQVLTRQGGWPMTVFLMPDGRPFYGGTYYPPEDRQYGHQRMPGFRHILLSIYEVYQKERQRVEKQANEIADYLQKSSSTPLRARGIQQEGESALDLSGAAARELAASFDARSGGFGDAPKFPNTMALEFLLRVHLHTLKGEISVQGKDSALEIVESSLQHMANGGIYDQLGGGFHRYSVDAAWLVPHFEKMLYDNALLSRLYLHAYLVTGKPIYRRIVEETLDYVIREMTSPEGGFYSTQDADSEGEEGKFFLWTPQEIEKRLSPQDARLFMIYYDVTPQGNFEDKNILHVSRDVQAVANELGLRVEEAEDSLKRSREILFNERELRVRPGRDEKILTAWNGLMLRSFAEAARYLKRPAYLSVASNNASFLLSKLRDTRSGRLLRTYKDGRARLHAYLEDYMFLASGLLALYEASFDLRWFVEARALTEAALRLFTDEQNGGFFDTGSDHEELVSRPKEIMDNAIPAGNSVGAELLLRLAAFSGEASYRGRADDYLRSITDMMVQHPQAFGHALNALDFAISPVKEIAVVGDPESPETQSLLEKINTHYLPNSVLACGALNDSGSAQTIALLADRTQNAGKATVYVCQNFACQVPVNTVEELEGLLL
jgi:hypothetical protein